MTLRTRRPVVSSGPLLTLVLGAVLVSAIASERASAQLADAASEVRPLLVGSEAPDVPLTTADGTPITLHAVLGDAPAIVVFYRGGW